MTKMIRRRVAMAGTLVAPMLARHGWAQSAYPSKQIRMVVPFAPAGTTDLLGRIAAQHLTEAWGQTVIVDNKSGAGGNVGAEVVAHAPPDGYTLLLGTVGTAVTNQYLYKNMPYDSVKSFAPVALFGEVANVLAVDPKLPVKTAKEYVEYCKKQGDNKVSFGSPAVGGTGHLAMEYFESLAGFKVEHVVYRGSSLVLKDLLAGHIPSTMDNLPPYLPHIQSGTLRALGVSSAKRWFALPDVPTIAEQGVEGVVAVGWIGLSAPARTPEPILDRPSAEVMKILREPEVLEKLKSLAFVPAKESRQEFEAYIAIENTKWRKIVQDAGIKIE
jgi:tripartite-type tricarboxylate transporter receptor subunit TctC